MHCSERKNKATYGTVTVVDEDENTQASRRLGTRSRLTAENTYAGLQYGALAGKQPGCLARNARV